MRLLEEKDLKKQSNKEVVQNLEKKLNSAISLKVNEENALNFLRKKVNDKKERLREVKDKNLGAKGLRVCKRKHSKVEEVEKLIPLLQVKHSRRCKSIFLPK